MVLINLAVTVGPAGVAQVPPDAPLEEALAALAGEDTVVLAAGLVPTHHAVHLDATLVLVPVLLVAGTALWGGLLLGVAGVALAHAVGVPVGVSPSHHCHISLDHQLPGKMVWPRFRKKIFPAVGGDFCTNY